MSVFVIIGHPDGTDGFANDSVWRFARADVFAGLREAFADREIQEINGGTELVVHGWSSNWAVSILGAEVTTLSVDASPAMLPALVTWIRDYAPPEVPLSIFDEQLDFGVAELPLGITAAEVEQRFFPDLWRVELFGIKGPPSLEEAVNSGGPPSHLAEHVARAGPSRPPLGAPVIAPSPDPRPGSVIEARPPDGDSWAFDGVRLVGVRFVGITQGWHWLYFRGCTFVDCVFEDCTLDWVLGSTAADDARASAFSRCIFTRCDLRRAHLRDTRFEDCRFEECRWEAHLDSTDLVRNRFTGTHTGLTLWGREYAIEGVRSRVRDRANELAGNDFSQADLRGLTLRGDVPVSDQIWPSDRNFLLLDRVPERMRVLRRRIEESGDRDGLLAWLLRREVEVQRGVVQNTQVCRLDDPTMAPVHAQAFQELASIRLADAES